MTASEEQRATVKKLVEKGSTALVTTVDGDRLVSRPLAVLDHEFEGTLWFFTQDPSPKTDQVRANPQVNVAIQSGQDFISISGTATVSRDQARIDELWNRHAEAWFPEGRQDPAVALLEVTADTAEYWNLDSPVVVAAVKYAAAMVTGNEPDIGTNETVDL